MNVNKIISEIDRELSTEYDIDNAYQTYIGYIKFEDLFTVTNVYLSAIRCASGFRNRNDTQEFLKAPWLNSYKLYQSILDGTFRPKYYKSKFIMERGKVREIKPPVFESKVIQKILCDWLIRPLLEPEMITTSYASVMGKGTDKMYNDVLRAVNSCVKNKDSYIVMTDFKGYFSSIDLDVLRSMFEKTLKDERIVNLIMEFSKSKGLSLENELSQIPASFFPTDIDYAIKNAVSTGHYFRYMDDTLFIVSNKEETTKMIDLFEQETQKLKLILKEPKVIPVGMNFTFCKERFLFDKKRDKYFRLCNKDIFVREKRKLNLFKSMLAEKSIDMYKINMQYGCVRNSIVHRANSKKSLERLDKYYKELFNKKKLVCNFK